MGDSTVKALALVMVLLPSLPGQTIHGLGFSSKTCVDVDGDGYGTGPAAALITTSSSAVGAPGPATVTLGSAAGLVAGQRLRYDSSTNLEFVTITSVNGNNVTAVFQIPHAAGAAVSAGTTGSTLEFPGYTADDPGCLGLDADDRDATVHTAAQGINKYGSLSAFLGKLGNDIQVLEADTAAGSGDATAIGSLLRSPNRTYYLAPAAPSANCAGTPAQCTGAAYPTNNCITINTPCLTSSNLVSAGYSNTGAGGDLVILRDGWNGRLTFYSGATADFNGVMSFPGEHAVLDASASGASGYILMLQQTNCSAPDGVNYFFIDGIRFQNGSGIGGGTLGSVICATQATSDDHDIWIQHVEGTEGGSQGLGTIAGFNGINNWVVEYNALHDDNCPSSCNSPHGIYLGSHEIASSNTTIRRNLVYRNSWNGVYFNGAITGLVIEQNVIYDHGGAAIDLSMGVSNSYIRSNVLFNNDKNFQIYDYTGSCASQGTYNGQFILCPGDQTGNLIENNTFYSTGNIPPTLYNPASNPDAGCPAGIYACAQSQIQVSNISSPLAGNLGGNIYRNNIVVNYGKSNGYAAISYGTPIGTCAPACQGWAAVDTFDHNLFYQSDGNGSSATAKIINLGSNTYTLSTAGGVTGAFTSNLFGDPKFVAEAISEYNLESFFDLRLLPSSPALRSGATTGLPGYDCVGRAFVEGTPSMGGCERNLYAQGWTAAPGADWNSSVAPQNGAPLDALTSAITSTTQTAITVAGGAPNAQVGNLMLLSGGGANELVCINGVSGNAITVGVNLQCSGTASSNGRGWAGTTPATFTTSGTIIYYNTLTVGGLQGTDPGSVYPFQTKYHYLNDLGAGWDGVGRDIPGQTKEMCFGGGGHVDYIGNEIYCMRPNVLNPATSIISGPSTFAIPGFDSVGTYSYNSTSSGDAELKDGTWNAAHIEGNFVYNAWEDKFAKFGGGYAGNGLHSYDTFEFNFVNNRWERFGGALGGTDTDCSNYGTGYTSCAFSVGHQVDPIGNFNPGASGFSGLAVADPVTKTDWELWRCDTGCSPLTQYYPTYHQHVLRATNQPNFMCCGIISQGSNRVFISDLRYIFLQGINATLSTYVINIFNATSQTPAASPNPSTASVTTDASCAAGLATPSPGLAYIPQISRVLIFPANAGGNTFYLMDPTTWACTSRTFLGGPPPSPVNPRIAGAMQYFPSLDVTTLIDDYGANVARVLSLTAGDPTAQVLPPSGASTTYSGVTIF